MSSVSPNIYASQARELKVKLATMMLSAHLCHVSRIFALSMHQLFAGCSKIQPPIRLLIQQLLQILPQHLLPTQPQTWLCLSLMIQYRPLTILASCVLIITLAMTPVAALTNLFWPLELLPKRSPLTMVVLQMATGSRTTISLLLFLDYRRVRLGTSLINAIRLMTNSIFPFQTKVDKSSCSTQLSPQLIFLLALLMHIFTHTVVVHQTSNAQWMHLQEVSKGTKTALLILLSSIFIAQALSFTTPPCLLPLNSNMKSN